MDKIFISYRRSDTASQTTDRLYEKLCDVYEPSEVFYDHESIAPGENYEERMLGAAGDARVMLVMIGQAWPVERLHEPNDPVLQELEAAAKGGAQVLPVLVGEATMPELSELPEGLGWFQKRNAVKLGSGSAFRRDFPGLVETINTLIKKGRFGDSGAVEDQARGYRDIFRESLVDDGVIDTEERERLQDFAVEHGLSFAEVREIERDVRAEPEVISALSAPAPAPVAQPEPKASDTRNALSEVLDAAFDKTLGGLEALKTQIVEAEEALPPAGSEWAQQTLQKLASQHVDPSNEGVIESVKAACHAPPSETVGFVRVIKDGDDIHAALDTLPPGGVLHIKAKHLVLTRTLELKKRVHIMGAPGSSISRAMSMDEEDGTISFWSRAGGSLSTLRVLGQVIVYAGAPLISGCEIRKDRGYDAALIVADADPTVIQCSITRDPSAAGSCGIRLGEGSVGVFRENTIYGTRWGVLVQSGCAGEFKENDIHTNESGVVIEAHSCTIVDSNQIHDNEKHGIFICEDDLPVNALVVTDYAEVRDNRIYGNGQAGIFIKHDLVCEGNTVEQNKVGVYVMSGGPEFRKNTVRRNAEAGVYIGGAEVIYEDDVGAAFEDNEISHNGVTGVLIEQGATPLLRNNRVFSNADVGVLIRGAKGTIRDNEIYENTCAGLQADTDSSPEVSDNVIRHNKENGISLQESAGVYAGNDIHSNENPGIAVLGAKGSLFRDNHIHDGTNGVVITNGRASTFEGNTISGNKLPAVVITAGAKATFKRNTLRDGAHAGVVIQEGGLGHFEANAISGHPNYGVIIQESQSHGTFVGNTISEGAPVVVAVLNQAGAVFERNTITGGRDAAVFVSSGAAPEFRNNRVQGAQASIFVDGAGRGRFIDNTLSPDMAVACQACGGVGLIPKEKRGFFGKASIERCAECLEGGRVYRSGNS